MKKKALSFVLAMMLMSSVLSGCGGTGKTDTSTADKSESVSDTSTASDVSKESNCRRLRYCGRSVAGSYCGTA